MLVCYSWFHIKGTWSVHSYNGDYLSIPKCTGSCGYLFHEKPSITINSLFLQKIYIYNPKYFNLQFCNLHLYFTFSHMILFDATLHMYSIIVIPFNDIFKWLLNIISLLSIYSISQITFFSRGMLHGIRT